MQKIKGADCDNCPFRFCTFVPPVINDSNVIVITDIPSKQDDILAKALRDKQVSKTSVVLCRPLNNKISDSAIKACQQHLDYITEGKDILLLGDAARDIYLPSNTTKGAVTIESGRRITSTYSPENVAYNPALFWEFYDTVCTFVNNREQLDWRYFLSKDLPLNCTGGNVFIVDTETNTLKDNDIIMVGLMPIDEPNKVFILTEHDKILDFINLVNSGMIIPVFHNAPFDMRVLQQYGLSKHVEFDDTLVMHLMVRETPPHGLEEIARLWYGQDNYKSIIDEYKPNLKGYRNIPEDILTAYLIKDLIVTKQLYNDLSFLLTNPNYKRAIALQRAIVVMESNGIPVNIQTLLNADDVMSSKIQKLRQQLHDVVMQELSHKPQVEIQTRLLNSKPLTMLLDGKDILNPGSWLQMRWALHTVLNLPEPQKNKGTGKTALAELKNNYDGLGDHIAIKSLEAYRRISKLKTGYVNVMLKQGDIIHANFQIHGTEIGRLSTKDPTIHGIPRADDFYGNFIRASVTAPNHKVVVVDYAQIELRVAAMLSGEPVWVDAFREGRDPHGAVAIILYGDKYTKAERTYCKNFNFAYLYGGNEYSFASQVNLPIAKATQFVKDYKAKMIVLETWKEQVVSDAISKGYVENPFGRRRRFPYVNRQNMPDVRKQALHFLVSSTASDICTIALTRLIQANKYNIVASVHDSIIGIEHDTVAYQYADEYKEVMVNTAYEKFPNFWWDVDIDVNMRWSPYPVAVSSNVLDTLGLTGKPPFTISMSSDGARNIPELQSYLQEDYINLWNL